MPATADNELILAVRNLKDNEFRLKQIEVLEQYIVACDLSRGPDPDRSDHWTSNAVGLRLKLQKALSPPKPNPKDGDL